MAKLASEEPPDGRRLIFVRWFVHPKTKQRVYPRNGKVFPIFVKD